MFRFGVLWMICSFSQFPVWVWFCLSTFPVFLLLSLCSIFQPIIKSICLYKSTDCGSRNHGCSEGLVDSETSSTKDDEFDVFLSFRGPDTRQGFTDVLYETMKWARIRVFRDDDEVSVGQPLEKILHAIGTSQICVPIFSRTFAESSWCLREVARMIELKKDVMPIFYKVKPDDLKLKSGAYSSHLKMHEKKKGKDQVKVWAGALKEVARIKGKEVLNTGHTEFCKKFVDEVLSKLKPRKRSNTQHLVGMDSAIESVMKLMEIDSPDVLFICIHGMGGIGKTTLAKAIFEELSASYDCSCFLENVRESSLRCNGLQDLKKELQAALDPEFTRGCNYFRGIEERFRRKKVLIVLDDVDKSEQIEKLAGQSGWFGPGSRIIVTTRNMDVLSKNGNLDQSEVRFFKVMTLEDDQALELFQWYAFKRETPPAMLETISREIVSTAGGLPLVLKVTGSHLYNTKDERVWRDVLKRSIGKDVKGRLRISYDALELDQKKIFLDIACVPDMQDKVKSVYMWEISELLPHCNLEALSSMSLVEFDDGKIWMHDLLKDLGKYIDREDCIKVPGKRRRVCGNEEALDVLLSKEGKEEVEVLCVDKPLEILSLTHENFAMFRQLRFLKLDGTIDIEGDFKNLLPKLAWFIWHKCPPILNATNLYMKNLVVLNLSHSFISQSWGGWSLIQTLNNLKDLDLSYCKNLTTTPDFSGTNRLERLKLSGCSELRELHDSIGKLQRLKYLKLFYCDSLCGFPDEIGYLVNLEELWVSRSRSYWKGKSRISFKLPNSIGNLKSLSVLQFKYLEITDIPDSIGRLAKLKRLCLQTVLVKVLPESLGDLESLVELTLYIPGISELPNSLGRLVKLKELSLCDCRNLEELPESLGSLQELKVLEVELGKIRKIPAVSVGKLKKLEMLTFSSVGGMLEEVPIELPLSLSILSISSRSLHKTPDLSRLTNLAYLRLLKSDDYRWPQQQQLPQSKFEGIGKLTELRSLELGVVSATALLQFDLTGSLTLLKLRSLTLDFQPDLSCDDDSVLPSTSSLALLDISQGRLELKLPDLSGLKNLSDLVLNNCLIEDGGELESLGIHHLGNVTYVCISNCCVNLIEVICLLKNVTLLQIYNCESLKTLNLSELKNLKKLDVIRCKEIVEITGLGNLESLYITRCESLKRLKNLSKLEKLAELLVWECPNLRTIEGTERLDFSTSYFGNRSPEEVDELKYVL